jgi:hypothetical protein
MSPRGSVEMLDTIYEDLFHNPIKKGLAKLAKPLNLLVAGAGFEPTTFGL